MNGRLSVVATPIGNLDDITLRALQTLGACDVVLCEDTRVTKKLLERHEIDKPKLIRCDQHAPAEKYAAIIELLRSGKHVALVTDAGTPGVSDPGGLMVAEVVKALPDVRIEVIPGPSALTALASIAGLPVDRFLFLGFLPLKHGRSAILDRIIASKETVFFYESKYRVQRTLEALATRLGDRMVVIGRELTKMHETVLRGTVSDVLALLEDGSTKGEFVVAIAGNRDN
ncbi:MAG: 16S rRNA (cytidine(1402)-2'-O)-methyltransferase [Candidatus Uhrbacteria bacterium]